MIKISIKGLAKFMTGSAAGQRKLLRDFKYPEPEGRVQAIYYREARDFIITYHKKNHLPDWLTQRADDLMSLASQAHGHTQSRYRNNARALTAYENNFAYKAFEILSDISLAYSCGGVLVTIHPDLHVREKGVEKLIKLEFAKETPDDRMVKIITQALFEAQINAGMGLPSSAVLLFDVVRGEIYRSSRIGSRMKSEIEAACNNIAAIWHGI